MVTFFLLHSLKKYLTVNIQEHFHLYGKTGENFPPNGKVQYFSYKKGTGRRPFDRGRFLLVWKNQCEFSAKCNSTIVPQTTAHFIKKDGNHVMMQMV